MDDKPACVIGHIRVKDEETWARYRAQVPATLAPWGGEVLFRGHLAAVWSGSHDYPDTVVIRFPDADHARRWFESPAYQALIPLRREAADVVLLGFEP